MRSASDLKRDTMRSVRANSTDTSELVDLADALLHLFGVVSRWHLRARGFAMLLALPVLLIGISDWRIRRRR